MQRELLRLTLKLDRVRGRRGLRPRPPPRRPQADGETWQTGLPAALLTAGSRPRPASPPLTRIGARGAAPRQGGGQGARVRRCQQHLPQTARSARERRGGTGRLWKGGLAAPARPSEDTGPAGQAAPRRRAVPALLPQQEGGVPQLPQEARGAARRPVLLPPQLGAPAARLQPPRRPVAVATARPLPGAPSAEAASPRRPSSADSRPPSGRSRRAAGHSRPAAAAAGGSRGRRPPLPEAASAAVAVPVPVPRPRLLRASPLLPPAACSVSQRWPRKAVKMLGARLVFLLRVIGEIFSESEGSTPHPVLFSSLGTPPFFFNALELHVIYYALSVRQRQF